jgi:hypothetical protein
VLAVENDRHFGRTSIRKVGYRRAKWRLSATGVYLDRTGFTICSALNSVTEGSQQNVPWLEQDGHVRRRKLFSFRRQQVKLSGGDGMI